MRITKPKSGSVWLDRSAGAALVESHAQRVLGISTDEFVRRWRAGRYRGLDSDECPGLMELAMIAPITKLTRRKSGRKITKRSGR